MKDLKITLRQAFLIIALLISLQACNEHTITNSQAADELRPKDPPGADVVISALSASEHCEAIIASVKEAGFIDTEAIVTCDDGHAYIHSDSYASHVMMTGIVATNEQIPVPAPGYYAPIKFNPGFTGELLTRDSSLAVAVNGIPIFDYSSGGEMSSDELYHYHERQDTIHLKQLDICGGHTGRGDDYHYHELPRCMLEQMANKDENPIIGWGFDGFPLYANNNPDGTPIEPGTLDVCNGQPDPVYGYRYHTSDQPPYIIQCLVGEVGDLDAVPTIGFDRPIGRPRNVENLAFEHDGQGDGLLTYDYEGQEYYIKSAKTEKPECFAMEWKTITNGGQVESGEYCHFIRTGPRPEGGMGEGGMGMGGMGGMGTS